MTFAATVQVPKPTLVASRRKRRSADFASSTDGSTAANSSTVQVLSENHKVTDGAPASVLSNSICAMPGQKSQMRSRKSARPATAEKKPTLQSPGKNSDGLTRDESQTMRAVGGDDADLKSLEAHPLIDPVVAELIQMWRMRKRWHRAEKSLVLQGKAVCRSWCDGDKVAASKLFDEIRDGAEADSILASALMPFLSAIAQFEPERAAIEKRLRKLALKLPISAWTKSVAGFGELRLAALVGECGDIGTYRNPSCLWKRMGLAVIRGERQRRASEPDLALEMGYSPERRSVAYLLGQEIMRGAAKAKTESPYRKIYDERRDYEMPRCEALSADMKRRFGKYSAKAHAHNRAARYMTKRILRDLWVAWRRSLSASQPIVATTGENKEMT